MSRFFSFVLAAALLAVSPFAAAHGSIYEINPQHFGLNLPDAMHDAARDNDLPKIRHLIVHGKSVNAKSGSQTPLHYAARGNAREAAALLIANGAGVYTKNRYGQTPLYVAAEENARETAALLITSGADVNTKSNSGMTALHVALRSDARETAALLIANGADVNAKDDTGMTALHWAASKNISKIAEMLLAGGADINAEDDRGRTALRIAKFYHNEETADLLRNYTQGQLEASPKTPKIKSVAETVFENTWRSIVVIKSGERQGSGVIVRPNIVATNCHVLDGDKITVYKHDNRRASTDTLFAATVRKQDSEKDFCLLDVAGLWGIPAQVRQYGTLKIGESVYALGSPKGLDLSLSAGLISQLRQGSNSRIIQTDAAISPGSSGGGLFDTEGNLIGITTAAHKDDDAENVGFAIPADLALGL